MEEKVQLYEVIVLSETTLYGIPVNEQAPVVGPVITEGAAGTFLLTEVDALPLEPHALTAATVILPDEGKPDPKETEMELVPCPEMIVAPVGTAQLYDVAPETAATLNVRMLPGQIRLLPPPMATAPGVAGVGQFTQEVKQAALLMALTITEVGCGPKPLLKLIPTPLTKWQ